MRASVRACVCVSIYSFVRCYSYSISISRSFVFSFVRPYSISSFVPTPSDVSWYEMRKDFNKFVNQLYFKAKNILEPNANKMKDVTINTDINAPKKPESNIAPLHRTRETKCKNLEKFIKNMEKELLTPKNVKLVRM